MPAPRLLAPIGLLILAILVPGCGEPAHPSGASPVVSADSEAARKAIADADEVQKLRRQQEAKAHRRSPNIRTDG